jgi:hypothetical protein
MLRPISPMPPSATIRRPPSGSSGGWLIGSSGFGAGASVGRSRSRSREDRRLV